MHRWSRKLGEPADDPLVTELKEPDRAVNIWRRRSTSSDHVQTDNLGPRARDVRRLKLRDQPTDHVALSVLNQIARGESDIFNGRQERAVIVWPASDKLVDLVVRSPNVIDVGHFRLRRGDRAQFLHDQGSACCTGLHRLRRAGRGTD